MHLQNEHLLHVTELVTNTLDTLLTANRSLHIKKDIYVVAPVAFKSPGILRHEIVNLVTENIWMFCIIVLSHHNQNLHL